MAGWNQTRDVRLTLDQMGAGANALGYRVRDLERRLARTSYAGKPGMKDAAVKELAELRELQRVLRHNYEACRRQVVARVDAKLGLSGVS